ncbi:nuclease-related domain-containing protein [Oscillospiraceae bacterium PP1C4]
MSAIVALGVALAVMLYMRMRSRAGETDEKKRVSKLLHSFAKPRGFRVIDDAVLQFGGLSGRADHIVVGHFGILLVYDLCGRGTYYGKAEEDKWVLVNESEGRRSIDNPLRSASAQCTGRIRILLKEAGLKTSIESMAVITASGKETESSIHCEEVVQLNNLRKYLKKAKFEQDKDVDVNAVAAILAKALK